MSERTIMTQAGLERARFNTQQVGENLNEHVNASLSKAHAINIVDGYVDADGNDRTTYQNSAGDIVGVKQLRFNVGGALYYAPCNPTLDAGQPDSTGQVDPAGSAAELAAVGGSAWVTDTVTEVTTDAESVNTGFLLPHTLKKHEEVHGNFSVVVENTNDSAGNQVGTHKVRFVLGGIRYAVPAVTRIGGPPQPPRNVQALPSATGITYQHPYNFNTPVTASYSGGTAPVTWQWQIFSSTPSVGWISLVPQPGTYDANPGDSRQFEVQWPSINTPNLVLVTFNPGNGKTYTWQFRVIATSAGGSTISEPFSFKVRNKSTCCFTFVTARDGQALPAWMNDRARQDYYTPATERGYKQLSRWLVPWMNDRAWLRRLVRFLMVDPCLNWGRWRYEQAGWPNPVRWLTVRSWLLLWRGLGRWLRHDPEPPEMRHEITFER